MQAIRVGMREFRADMADYIDSNTPVAITRHGQTVGYFIPARGHNEANIAALKQASKTLDELIEANGIDIEEIVAEFNELRKKGRRQEND